MIDSRLEPDPLPSGWDPPPIEIVEPGRRGWRSVEVLRVIAGLLWGLFRSHALGELSPEEAGRRVRRTCEGLGGLWLRLAELLVIQEGGYPREFRLAVGELAGRAKGFPPAIARRTIEEEFGRPIHEIFSEFEDAPVAAGSIGQIHRAVLRKGGRRVAVKVRRPDVGETFRRDHRLAVRVLRFLARFRSFEAMRFRDAAAELDRVLAENIDYRWEGAALLVLGRVLKRHGILVPRTWRRWLRERVLVMEWVPGVSLSDWLQLAARDPDRARHWLLANEIDLSRVGLRLVRSYLRQLLEEPYFHCHLHPSNLFLLRSGNIAAIDFGLVSQVPADFQRAFALFVQALADRSFREAASRFVALFEPVPPVDLDRMKQDLAGVMRRWHACTRVRSLPYESRSLVFLTANLARTCLDYGLGLDWSLVRIDHGHLAVDAAARELCPQVDYPEEFARYFRKALRRRLRENVRSNPALDAGVGMIAVAEGLSHQLSRMGSDMGSLAARQALRLETSTTKVAAVLQVLLRRARLFLHLGVLALAAIYVDLRVHPFEIDRAYSRLHDLTARLEWTRTGDWIVAGAALLLAGRALRRIERRLSKKEVAASATRG